MADEPTFDAESVLRRYGERVRMRIRLMLGTAQVFIIGFAAFFLTGVCTAFSLATNFTVLKPKTWNQGTGRQVPSFPPLRSYKSIGLWNGARSTQGP